MHRRAALSLVAGAAASLAGCGGFTGSASESSEVPSEGETVTDGPSSGTATAPESLLVRVDTARQPIWLADADGTGSERPTPRPDQYHIESTIVDSESKMDRFSVAPEVDEERVDSFLEATDFDAETVFLETIRVEECFRLELCRISWQPRKVSTDYVRRGRSWNEACAVDTRIFEARLIRIPDRVQANKVRAGSTSIGGSQCTHRGHTGGSGEGGSDPPSSTDIDTNTWTPRLTDTTSGGEE